MRNLREGKLSLEVSNYPQISEAFTYVDLTLVLSLVGVVLIARPPFLFGRSSSNIPQVSQVREVTNDSAPDVTPDQRLIAVGYVYLL